MGSVRASERPQILSKPGAVGCLEGKDDDHQEEGGKDGRREKMNAWDKTSTDSSMACSATKADRVATASVDSHSRRANITSNEATRG